MEDLISSPDPLNDSPTFYSPRKTRRTTKPRQSFPARTLSPTKQTFELDVGNKLSPQKLIVTVEAESEGGYTHSQMVGGQSSPSRRPNKTRERTTTTTIPVKGLSDSENEPQANPTPKRGRGRPRKSIGTPVPAKKGRNSTPTRRKSIGDLVDGDDEDDVNYRMGKNVEMGRGKGKLRSRSTKGTSRKSTPAPEIEEVEITTGTRQPRGRPSRKSQAVREDSNGPSIEEGLSGQAEMSRSLEPIETNATLSEHSATYPTPSLSPEKSTFSQYAEDSIALVPVPQSEDRYSSIRDESIAAEEEEHEDDDELGELREFDTILESEEFSMISVDSVPSLRNLSSPANMEDKPIVKPTNKSIEALRDTSAINDSFSSVPEEILIAATPARKVQSRNLSVPATVDNSFSSIPPEILEAATPARKTFVSKFQSAKSNNEDSFSSLAPEILQAATPARVLPKKTAGIPHQSQTSTYDDDYSTSPPLISGTPGSAYRYLDTSRAHGTSNGFERHRTVSATHSTASRLPTPEESSSPEDASSENLMKSGKASMTNISSRTKDVNTTTQSSLQHSYMQSSPPLAAPQRYTYTAHLRRRSQLHPDVTQTPSIVFSSPSLPPPINDHREQVALKSDFEQLRPALSPVARAGQALQSIIVPSSPRSRSMSLGSPFKSPAAERQSSSVSRGFLPSPSQERGIKHLPRLDLNNNLFPNSHASSGSQRRQDDPFSNSEVIQQRSPSPEEDLRPYKLGLPGKSRGANSKNSTIKSADLSMSEDAMSWQAEEEVPVPESSSASRVRLSAEELEQKWADERSAVSRQISSADPRQVITIDSDNGEAGYESPEDGEDFDLLLETINSSSPVHPPQEQQSTYVEKPRRSKIPSPWRKNSKRLIYSDELSHFSSPVELPKASLSSGLANFDRAQAATTVRRIETPVLSDEIDPANLSNWQIPQKANFQPRVRETGALDLSALLSPVKALPILPKSSRQTYIESISASSAELQDVVAAKPKERITRRDDPFAPIPQKMGFNPTPRSSSPIKQPTQGLFNNPPKSQLFTPSPAETTSTPSQDRSPLTLKNPKSLNPNPQPDLSFSPLYNTSPSTHIDTIHYPPLPVETAEEKENQTRPNDDRTLKWTQSLHLATKIVQTPLPTRTISPTKSCFRTPIASPVKNVQFASSSPLPSPSEEVLSATEWSKKHWLLLEEILAVHQAELPATGESSQTPHLPVKGKGRAEKDVAGGKGKETGRRRRNSTRVISRLLGKKVSSQGEEMYFEQWHLEVVDEFRGRVPGWEEKVVAMRVFALLVGAERRRLGLI